MIFTAVDGPKHLRLGYLKGERRLRSWLLKQSKSHREAQPILWHKVKTLSNVRLEPDPSVSLESTHFSHFGRAFEEIGRKWPFCRPLPACTGLFFVNSYAYVSVKVQVPLYPCHR